MGRVHTRHRILTMAIRFHYKLYNMQNQGACSGAVVARSPHNLEARVRSQTQCLFSCEGERLTCCTLRLAKPTSLGVWIPHVCPSHSIPTWEPFPVRFPETTRT